jgi:hypothetical protein
MSFRDQQAAALQGIPLYGIYNPSEFISKPEWEQFRHDDLNGLVMPVPHVPHRQEVNLPFDPQELYAPHNTTHQGYHMWHPLDAAINNGKILPSPPRERGAIIGKVQHVNYDPGYLLHGGVPVQRSYFEPKDPVWSEGTLGVPFNYKFPHLAQHKQ